jgi:transcriptional regulator with XRE-family HTH domain
MAGPDLTPAERIRATMKAHRLTYEAVSQLLHVSKHTVAAWLKPTTTKSHNPAPMMAAELLELKAGQAPESGRLP